MSNPHWVWAEVQDSNSAAGSANPKAAGERLDNELVLWGLWAAVLLELMGLSDITGGMRAAPLGILDPFRNTGKAKHQQTIMTYASSASICITGGQKGHTGTLSEVGLS